MPAIWAVPEDAEPEASVLYFHGGAFMASSMHTHRKVAGHLARATRARVLIIDFRLAPEHRHPAQLEDALTAYRWIGHTRPGDLIALAGDSGGGLLAVMTALHLHQEGEAPPAAIAALSPWFDLAAEFGESYTTNAERDLFITPAGLQGFTSNFLGDNTDPRDPSVNPYYTDLSGLPPAWFAVGGAETLLDSVHELATRANAAGADAVVAVTDDMQHDFVVMAGNAPEADAAISAAGTHLRTHLVINIHGK